MDRWWPRMATLVAVLAVHATVLMGVFRQQSRDLPREVAAEVLATAEIIGTDGELDKLPAPDLQLENVPVDVEGLQDIDFDDSIRDELAGVIASVSVPHLARVQRVEPATFARRAQLPPGLTLTVLLRIEVRQDGSVGAVDIVRTSGNATADGAAIAYALKLRWVPGTEGHSPKTMRVNFPVTFVSFHTE